MGADKTSFRNEGKNGWVWVYEHLAATVYETAPTWGKPVGFEVLEGCEGTLGHDAWDSYDSITTADLALDPVHVNRWRERAEVRHRIEPRRRLSETPAKFTSAGHPPTELLRSVDRVRSVYREAILAAKDRTPASQAERRRGYGSRSIEWRRC